MSWESSEDFVGYGTPVEQLGNDDSLTRLANENKLKAQKVKDKQGRERFHGAFTGGYSAGYYNTVGTAEGWAPSTFTSSRQQAKDASDANKPEDYMDEEDLEAFGIAPRQIQTTEAFRKGNGESRRAAWDPVVPGLSKTITDVIKPVHLSAAVRLLGLMGWKQGQGIGPRIKRKHTNKKTGQRIMGPCLPTSQDEDAASSENEVDEYISNVTFAPKDLNPINFSPKDDLHGIGYQALSVKTQSKSSAIEEERLTFGGHRQGISGQAFGVGIEEEDEDADIYGKERMSDYDTTLGDEPADLHSFTKPSGRLTPSSRLYQSSKVLHGFCLAQKKDNASEEDAIPEIPRGYKPKAAVSGTSQLPKVYGKLDKTLRGLIIGESIQGLLPVQDTKQTDSFLPGKEEETNLNEVKPVDNQQYVQHEAPLPPMRSSEPLNKQSVDFKPFAKHPEKQARYERYRMLKQAGDRDAYNKVAPADFRMRDKEREREEFERSGKFFKDLSGVMASRFTRSKQTDDDDDSKVSVRIDEESDALLDDKKQAVKMKMFGELTRESYEWHPHKVVCKRFNIPNPYPDSQLVGLPTVYKEKISAYNFLDIETLTTAPSELAKRDTSKVADKSRESDAVNESSSGPKSLPAGEKASVDLFKAVFQDSESDLSVSDSEDKTEIETKSEQDDTIQDSKMQSDTTLQKLQEQYSLSRDVAMQYIQPSLETSATEIHDTTAKVTFVPKKNRYKSETSKVRKSRWSNLEDSSEVTSNTLNNRASDVPQQSGQLEFDEPVKDGEDIVTVNSLGSVKNNEHTEIVTSHKSCVTPESDEDCWMPALPPPADSTSVSPLDKHHSHVKKHKRKEKHKKERKKNKSDKEEKKKKR